MIFTLKTYEKAHRRIVKKLKKAWRRYHASPMGLDKVRELESLHDRILQRLSREMKDWWWV